MAHLAMAPVMSRSSRATMRMKLSSSSGGGALEHAAQLDRYDHRHVRVAEVGDELAEDQHQEDQAAQAADGFLHGLDHVAGAGDRPGPDAVTHAGRQEQEHDEDDHAVHEWRVPQDRG